MSGLSNKRKNSMQQARDPSSGFVFGFVFAPLSLLVLRAPEALTPFPLLTGLRPSRNVLEVSKSFWVPAKPEILETWS